MNDPDEPPDWFASLPENFRDPEKLANRYRDLQVELRDRPGARWTLRIKELRARHGLSVLEAERLALSDPVMRRWALRMTNSNQHCRKKALAHIRYNGEASLIERDGFVFSFREPIEQG